MKPYSNEVKPHAKHNQRKLRKRKVLGYIVKYIQCKFLKGPSFSTLKDEKQEVLTEDT